MGAHDEGAPGPRRHPRLSAAILSGFLFYVVFVMVVVSVALTVIFYESFERETERVLISHAEALAESLDGMSADQREESLQNQLLDSMRLTLVGPDGVVRYDSQADPSGMANHADRPEVAAARDTGEASAVRVSETLGTDTVYAAARLSDGSVVRVAQTRQSLASFLADAALPLFAALAVVAVSALVLSRRLTARIVRPFESVGVEGGVADDEVYAEMAPLIRRLDDQRQQLRQQNRELAEAATMRQEFSANVSHEMKTPLQVISGYAELMRDGVADGEDVGRFSGRIYDEAQSMRALIDDVLTLSQLDERTTGQGLGRSNWVEVDLLSLAERVRDRLASFAASQGVEVEVTGEHVLMRAHETLLEQALFNLVENGIRYNRPQGRVAVSVRLELGGAVPVADGVRVHNGDMVRGVTFVAGHAGGTSDTGLSYVRERFAVARVADTGYGIPDDQRERVFERFYRLEQSRSKETGGTGLGLAIVKHAAAYHDGDVRLLDGGIGPSGEGATFELRLPIAEGDSKIGR